MADYMVKCQPLLTAQSDYQIIFGSTDIKPKIDQTTNKPFEGERDPELWIGGSPVRLHFDMLREAFELYPEDENLIRISKAPEWAVAATIVMMHNLEPSLRQELYANDWHRVPIENWIEVLKPKLLLPERSGIYGKYRGSGVHMMRNFMNVTSRLDEKANWNKELGERSVFQARKCDWQDPVAPYTSWRETLSRLTLNLAREHIGKMGNERRVEDLDEWWQARHHAIPTGSSSERKAVQDQLLADPLFNPTDRPNKKAVAESLDEDHLINLLLQEPETHCRLSTKREPGNKNRPVHANNDSSFLVEAFALVHAEKEMDSVQGCCGRQDPNRVMDWIENSVKTEEAGGTWLSLDYPNYCTFHAKWELSEVSLSRSQAWLETTQPEMIKKQKALASLWIALGHFSSVMKLEAEDRFMFNVNGLYSGQRATLLDHNYMHRATSQAAVETVQYMQWICDPDFRSFTGDDEDAHFKHLSEAIGYVTAHKLNGNTFQTAKQVSGRHRPKTQHHQPSNLKVGDDFIDLDDNSHSYLQRGLSRGNLPFRPLARIIATIASGNWYVEPGIWYDSAINSTSDNFWECVTRGMDLNMAQILAKTFLDRLMIVRPTQEESENIKVKHLEWWAYANQNDHPLWRGTDAGSKACPIIVSKPEPHSSWPTKATEAWMKRVAPILEGLRESRVEQYRKYLLKESVGSSYHHYRQRALRDTARETWPERETQIQIETRELPALPSIKKVINMYRTMRSRRRPVSEEEQLARLGIDLYLYNLVGATKDLFSTLKPSDWARYADITPKKKVIDNWEMLDGAVQSWACNTEAEHPLLHKHIQIKVRTQFFAIYAANGAGKSWITDRYRGFCDMDIPVYAKVGWHTRTKRYQKADDSDIKEAIVTIDWAIKYDLHTILTQWPPEHLNRAAQIRGVELQWMGYDPGADIRRERLEARQYKDPSRVEELLDLADTLYATLPADTPIYNHYQQIIHDIGIF